MNTNIRLVGADEISDPMVLAMLQAFYSRSPMPIEDRLQDLQSDGNGETKEEKIKNAMQRYYVDYGHASIGEMGGCTVFIENVSMLAAKAIQDTPLYIGQECSTRYIDFSAQPFLAPPNLSPEETAEAFNITERYRQVYLKALPKLVEYAKDCYPAELVVSSKIAQDKIADSHEKTCKAIAFDMARGLLPAGACTSLAWTGNFRVFNDHLRYLSFHPLAEVRNIARRMYADLQQKYPQAFKNETLNPSDRADVVDNYYSTSKFDEAELTPAVLDVHAVLTLPKEKVPDPEYKYRSRLDHSVYFNVKGLLDFGSFRDLQRHRNGMNLMPLLTPYYGLHPFYVFAYDSACPEILTELDVLDQDVANLTRDWTPGDTQYLIPMGNQVVTHLYWSLGQTKYVVNLRTKTSVHPTLREYMQSVGSQVNQILERRNVFERVKVNLQEDYESSDRGEQTIKERN